ncbi:MAG: hypothetical protein RLZZ59_191, partial [Pseudomonadota bacterium]
IIQNYNIDKSKIEVIHRGIDYKYFDPALVTDSVRNKFYEKYQAPRDIPIILLPARLTRWKGHESLIKALSLIKEKDFYCIISGDLSKHPSFTTEIKDMIQDLKMQKRVQLFGPESDMVGLYSIADIVLSTSIEPEAFGRVAIEGQAMEKIVIATNIGGAIETVADRVNGYHVPPNDHEFLAKTIAYALDNLDKEELNMLRLRARSDVIKNFSIDVMSKKTLDLYNSLL